MWALISVWARVNCELDLEALRTLSKLCQLSHLAFTVIRNKISTVMAHVSYSCVNKSV